jgi:hypothetical protein
MMIIFIAIIIVVLVVVFMMFPKNAAEGFFQTSTYKSIDLEKGIDANMPYGGRLYPIEVHTDCNGKHNLDDPWGNRGHLVYRCNNIQ